MNNGRHGAILRLGAVALGVAAVLSSCASSRGRSDTLVTTEPSRKTQQQIQSELMAYADRFFAQTLDAARTLESTLDTPEGRYTAAGARLLGLIVTADIAASPNPGGAVLDMSVYVTLKRMAWEEHWMPEVYGEEAGQAVLDAYRELEDDIWGIAASVYTPDQIATVRDLIDDWRSLHPDTVAVDFVRLAELGDSRTVQNLIDAGRPGGLLAPVKEANRNIEEMRLLAERLAFMATRMQLMISLQVEMASAKLAAQPEVQRLLEDSRAFAEISDRAAETFATLVADLPEERGAAIDQILSGLRAEREQIFVDLAAEDGELRPALNDVRQTLEIGRELSAVLGETIRDFDVLAKRILEGDPEARPFNILEWQATLAEGTTTARELKAVVDSVDALLESAEVERQLTQVIETAKRLESEVIDDIIDRAFLRGVALIVIFFFALALYRWLMPRVAPEPGRERRTEE
jgi:hypothetical protein